MKKYSQQGFTLIELLVVIAIIGILSSVVLASLSTARNKGKDAAAQSSISSLRSQNEIFASSNSGSYGTAVTATQATTAALTSACNQAQVIALLTSINGNTGNTATCAVGVNGQTWVAWSKLATQTGANDNYCSDSTGFAGTQTTAPVSVITAAVSCK